MSDLAISILHPGNGSPRDSTLPRLPGVSSPQTQENSEESSAEESTLGTEEGDSQASLDLLFEGSGRLPEGNDTENVLKRKYRELSAHTGAASYHYDQYRYSLGRRNTVQREIKKIKERRTTIAP